MSAIHDLIEWALINGCHNDKALAKQAGVAVDELEAQLARRDAALEAAREALRLAAEDVGAVARNINPESTAGKKRACWAKENIAAALAALEGKP